CDPSDSVGILDRFHRDIEFTTSDEQFFEIVRQRNRRAMFEPIEYVAICSPNDLHMRHCSSTLLSDANAICEKPLVIDPCDLDALQLLEQKTGRRVYTILQLRLHEQLIALKQSITHNAGCLRDVVVTYVTGRGQWYYASWKGAQHRSGGIAMNIGIHLFDLLIWLFGKPSLVKLYRSEPKRMSGVLMLESARVRWFLSLDAADARLASSGNSHTTFRSITVDGADIDFTDGITQLHQRAYESILAGQGVGIGEARASIELTERLRNIEISPPDEHQHPLLLRGH
ncbi:MAG TPA: Gfo/Idh/MocA family oxidoreductase, partial [Polyangiaceae bacterium]